MLPLGEITVSKPNFYYIYIYIYIVGGESLNSYIGSYAPFTDKNTSEEE